MKYVLKILFAVVLFSFQGFAQGDPDKPEETGWSFNASIDAYFIPDDFYLQPTLSADKDVIHLEARYNYEEENTFSGWIGYNFQTGEDLEFTAVPMIAVVAGNLNGLAPGLELDLLYSEFEFYSESEYIFNLKDGSENFLYIWSELTYSPFEWFWFGIVGQRTLAPKTEPEFQGGVLAGLTYSDFELSCYLLSIGEEDTYFMLSAAVGF